MKFDHLPAVELSLIAPKRKFGIRYIKETDVLIVGMQIDPDSVLKEQLQIYFGNDLEDIEVNYESPDFRMKLDKILLAQKKAVA